VNPNQLKSILNRIDDLDKADLALLKKMRINFPFFQLPHILIARHESQREKQNETDSLAWAAITSPDRKWLKKIIEKRDVLDAKGSNDLQQDEVLIDSKQNTIAHSSKIASKQKAVKTVSKAKNISGDDLIETIKNKEKKEITDSKKQEQIELINAFENKKIKIATLKEIESDQNKINLAEKSTILKGELITESYARLLAKNNNKQQAIKIYEKLSLKFPQKSAYFASLIENLKNTD
jgi:hypothetical protein